MRILDSRRLRGPNLQTREPAAVAEVTFEAGEDPRRAVAAWKREAAKMARALGWRHGPRSIVARSFDGGAALAMVVPIDALYEATEVNEWVIARASAPPGGEAPRESFARARREFAARVRRSERPELVALHAAARRRNKPFLWDDDRVTLGMADRALTYDIRELPDPGRVRWSRVGRIPVALVTGTNGKTTTARLVARMAKLAGYVPGSTSTDGITVDEQLLEAGDFTGAEGARQVLRDPRVTLAVLETARGGILRRGLAVDACDAAVVTNVASDHLGEFGVLDLPTMARAKAVVGTVVRRDGHVVLNGDDPQLATLAGSFRARTILFSASGRVRRSGTAFAVEKGHFVRSTRGRVTRLGRVADAPLTFGGAAKHNVENCLAAAAVAWSLGIPDAVVSRALSTFGRDAADNPGRGRVIELRGGVRLLLDFGHNAAGLRDLLPLAKSLAVARGSLLCVHTQPGDRTPDDVAALTREIAAAKPRVVVFWESTEYLRGKRPGEVTRALVEALQTAGFPGANIGSAATETEAIGKAAGLARPGDVIVVAPHIGRAEIDLWVRARAP